MNPEHSRPSIGRPLPGFEGLDVPTSRGTIHVSIGGSGSPLLLLHGYPQTSLMWRAVAPLLAAQHTVVAADLAGYGDSFRPVPTADHVAHSKRALAADQVEAMGQLGFERFAVAGHDRGGRVAYRMALDHPERVLRATVIDIVPTSEVWARADRRFAQRYWHWSFLAQPAPLPERLIAADPQAYFDLHVRLGMGLGAVEGRYAPEVIAAYRQSFDDPVSVQAICEDYRAGASVDVAHDEADRMAGHRIACPLQVLWGANGALPGFYEDVLNVWRPWADELEGAAVEASHFVPEDQPEQTAAAILAFGAHD